MKLPDELKEAIKQLPSKEKDKLILRLLKKDLALANRFLFELVSNEGIDESRKRVESVLQKRIDRATLHYNSPGYLHMDVREMSGIINEHVLITKDRYGEAYLNLWMIN